MNIRNYLNVDEKILSKTERQVHEYLCEHYKDIKNISIDELAKRCYTSRATIDRYLKKVNINGFKELKQILVNDTTIENNDIEQFTNSLQKNKDKRILVVGFGSSYIAALYLERRLSLLDYNISAQSVAQIIGIAQKFDVIIIISNSGSIKHFKPILETYKSSHKLAITSGESSLAKQVNYYIDNKFNQNIKNLYEHDKQLHNFEIIEQIFDSLI